jgi:hypothetical protein
MREKKAKIVSLVPSWTETLLRAGAFVAGRTRFCIHPADRVAEIPVVGGTKTLNLDEILRLQPDFVIMDKEENRLEMAEALQKAGIEIIASDVNDFESAAEFLQRLSVKLQLPELSFYSRRYLEVKNAKISREKFFNSCVLEKNAEIPQAEIDYVIWKKPFMVIGAKTFISAVMKTAGILLERPEKYPKLAPEELLKNYSLFSTEPFPFAEEFPQLTRQGYRGALIDGEKISWYGIRNLEFMESCAE